MMEHYQEIVNLLHFLIWIRIRELSDNRDEANGNVCHRL